MIFFQRGLGRGKSVKFSDRFFMENFTLDLKKQQFLKGGKNDRYARGWRIATLEEHSFEVKAEGSLRLRNSNRV